MSSIVRLRAPKSLNLHKMSQQEIEKLVTTEADKLMAKLPKDFRLVGVNAVSVDQKAADVDVWAQWTRACCAHRAQIEEFTDPVRGELNALTTSLREATEHVESHFVVEDNRSPHVSDKDVKRRR